MARRENQNASPVPEDPFQPPCANERAQDEKATSSSLEKDRLRTRRVPSPSILPGVRSLPRELSNSLKDQLVPGKYYAKSMTQHLGPFDSEPTKENLPSGDTYFIMQNMGRIGESGNCIFRHVRRLVVPAKTSPAPRPISPSELPGIKRLNNELDDETKNNAVPGHYFAKSMTRCLGPFPNIPSHQALPSGESYVILQEMGNHNGCTLYRKITQIDR